MDFYETPNEGFDERLLLQPDQIWGGQPGFPSSGQHGSMQHGGWHQGGQSFPGMNVGNPSMNVGHPGMNVGNPGTNVGHPGMNVGHPGGGMPSPSFPGQHQGGPFPSFPGGQFPGHSGGQDGPPTGPPPSFTPQQPQVQLFAVDPGAIRNCRFRFTYIWLDNGRAFWFYPTFVGRNSIAGFRWSRNRWVYFGIDLNRIASFQCF